MSDFSTAVQSIVLEVNYFLKKNKHKINSKKM